MMNEIDRWLKEAYLSLKETLAKQPKIDWTIEGLKSLRQQIPYSSDIKENL